MRLPDAESVIYLRLVINAFTWVFLGMLVAATATQLWLAKRQIDHVRQNRDRVPEMFAQAVPLSLHQKAADYSVAKAQLEIIEILISCSALLLLTLGGLINWLRALWERLFDPRSLAHGVALCASVALLLALVDVPSSIYRTFSLEARFGFNRMTPRLFIVDLFKRAGLAA